MRRISLLLTTAFIAMAMIVATAVAAFAVPGNGGGNGGGGGGNNNVHVCQGNSCNVDGDNNTTNYNNTVIIGDSNPCFPDVTSEERLICR
jgi:hypothetical protein